MISRQVFVLCVALTATSLTIVVAYADTCAMSEIVRHGDENHTRIYASGSGLPALYYKADMDVNTDGAARSYHPDDPRAARVALNNMGNAISHIYSSDGRRYDCSPRSGECYQRYISTFEAARDANYKPTGVPRIETENIIPWRIDPQLGWKVPCTIESGPYAGFFVSQTGTIADSDKDVCDQARYLDALAINANVLPGGVDWRSQNTETDKTDLVVTRHLANGRIAYAINGDSGPANKIGEGSVALTAALGGVTLQGNETYTTIKQLALPHVEYLIFPTQDIRRLTNGRFDQADIDRFAEVAFETWGGIARLDACSQLQP